GADTVRPAGGGEGGRERRRGPRRAGRRASGLSDRAPLGVACDADFKGVAAFPPPPAQLRRWGGAGLLLGDGAAERALAEQPAALAAVHALDLIWNAASLVQCVARDLGVPVWRPSPKRDCLAHLTQGSFALGKYDARKGEEVVTRRRRHTTSPTPLASVSWARETTKGRRWPHENRAV